MFFCLERPECPCVALPQCKACPLYNVITLGNLTLKSSVDGRTLVCGSLNAKDADFARQVEEDTLPSDKYTLEVNARFRCKSSKILAGSMAVSTATVNVSRIDEDSNLWQVDGQEIRLADADGELQPRVTIDPSLPDRCKNVTAELHELSAHLAKRPVTPENTVSPPSNESNGKFAFHVKKVNCNGVAVFNVTVDPNSPSFNLTGITISLPAADIKLILINIVGTTIHLRNSMANDASSWLNLAGGGRARTVFHCPNAHSIKLLSHWYGALVAPSASVDAEKFRIYGAIAVQSLNAGIGIHNPTIQLPACI